MTTATLSISGYALTLTLEHGAPIHVAKALASTHGDPTALVRMGFADLKYCPGPEYRYVAYTRPGAWGDQWLTIEHRGREMFAGSVLDFVTEYSRGS